MGLFLKYKDYYKNETVVQSQPRTTVNNNGKQDYVAQTINTGVSIFGSLLSYTSDGKGGNDNEPEISKENQAKIDSLQSKLKENVYSKCGGTAESLNNAIQKGNDAVNAAQSKVDSFKNGTDEFAAKIDEIKKQNPDADTFHLEVQRAKQMQIAEQELKNAQSYKANMQVLKAEEENTLLEIERLKNENASPEVKYDVKEETSQLHNFNTKLRKFTDIISNLDDSVTNEQKKSAAQELKDAYFGKSGNTPIIDNPTAQKAWNMISMQVEKYLN